MKVFIRNLVVTSVPSSTSQQQPVPPPGSCDGKPSRQRIPKCSGDHLIDFNSWSVSDGALTLARFLAVTMSSYDEAWMTLLERKKHTRDFGNGDLDGLLELPPSEEEDVDRYLRLVEPTSRECVQSPLMYDFLSDFLLTGSSTSSVLAWTDGTMQKPTSCSSVSLKSRQQNLSRVPIIISSSCMCDDSHGGTSYDNPNATV